MKISERGYWENETPEGHAHDEGLAKALAEFFTQNNTNEVFDFGCGTGYYSRVLRDEGIFSIPVDGNPYTAKFLHDALLCIADLSKPMHFLPADWVLCLEVGEHIPEEFESTFFDNLDKHNRNGVVLSWAIPGQGGDGHVNCKTNEYIIDKMKFLGYEFDKESTNFLRESCAKYPKDGWWFRNTLMVFRRKK